MKNKVRDCFITAIKDEEKGKKHKGLLIIMPNNKISEEYLKKAISQCEDIIYSDKEFKIPEELYK